MAGGNLMTDSYTYDSLAKAYDNFLNPAMSIYINGGKDNILQKEGIAVDDMQVTLSVDGAATVQFQVADAFDAVNHAVKSKVKSNFKVGNTIEVAVGYGSALTSVFSGYVTEFKTSYQSAPSVSVAAVDFRRLLMQNKPKNRKFEKKTYFEIFSEVISNYKSFYKDVFIDEEKGEKKKVLSLFQDGTDYDFIKDVLCLYTNREFFVVGANVYFVDINKNKNACIQLGWGKNLVSFQRGSSYCNERVTVYSGQNDKTGSEVSSTVKTGSNTPALTKEGMIKTYTLSAETDASTMQNCVERIASKEKQKSIVAQGSLVGLPELVPGRYVEITGVDPEDAGVCYISEVTHSFGSDGFMTAFASSGKKDALVKDKKNQVSQNGGVNRSSGLMRAVVKKNWDDQEKENQGKVLVEFLTGSEGKKSTNWLPVIQPYCGNGYGMYFLPEVDTEVLVGSLTGDVNSLVVLGGLWNAVDILPENTAAEKNNIKMIRTRGNHEIVFDDAEEPKIEIRTSNKLHIQLNDKQETISIFDEKDENGIKIDTKAGNVNICAKQKLIFSAGGKDAVVIDGSKKVTIEATQIEEKGKQSFQIQTQKLEVKGNMTEIKASGSLKLNSSGMAEVKGSIVKIN